MPMKRSSQNSFKANFGECPECELRQNGVLRSSRQVFASGIMLAIEGVARQPSARGRSNPYVVGETTPTHHVLRLNLRARVDSLAPTRRPSGHHSRRPRLGLGPPGLKRPILTSDRSYGPPLGQESSTQAPRPAPDLARRCPLVPSSSALTCRPRRGYGCLQCLRGRP